MLDKLLLFTQLSAYAFTLLLAAYLLRRSAFHPLARATAGMLISFALLLADLLLADYGQAPAWVGRLLWAAYPLPVVLWLRTVILLQPGDNLALDRAWWTLALPITMLLILGGWLGNSLLDFEQRSRGEFYWAFALYNLLGMLLATALLHRYLITLTPTDRAYQPVFWLRLAGLFFSGSLLLLLLGLSPRWVFSLLVLDVAILGGGMIAYDAVAEGHSIGRDFGLTLLKALLLLLVLVLPWAWAVTLAAAWTPLLWAALLLSVAAVALGVSLLESVEASLEGLLFPGAAAQQQTRAALRTLLHNSSHQAERAPDVTTLAPEEFTRLTRRALSHLPNLPRLAASPLTDMQVVRERLDDNANSLQRAGELRLLLTECIEALRPQDRDGGGITDEWRFYNALYYPYVLGLSPYKRSLFKEAFDEQTWQVIEWFRVAVPPRTLYNWQNRGAELIAALLLEREQQQLQGQ